MTLSKERLDGLEQAMEIFQNVWACPAFPHEFRELIAAARREAVLRNMLEEVADMENPEHYGNARDALHAMKLRVRERLDAIAGEVP